MTVTGADLGTVIDVATAEHRRESGDIVPLGQHSGYRYICSGNATEAFETFDLIAVIDPVIDFVVHDRHRPRPEGASFTCSDPVLNEIY